MDSKSFYESKTLWFSFILGAVGAAQTQIPAMQELMTGANAGWVIIIIAVISGGLRAVTDQGVTLS